MLGKLSIATLTFAVSGCSLIAQGDQREELYKVKAELAATRSKLALQETLQAGIAERVTALEGMTNNAQSFAYLDPAGGSGYQYVTSNVAPVLISFRDSSPVGDGTKVSLQIGNITSASFSGVELTATYNTRVPSDTALIAGWNAASRTVTAKTAVQIDAGAWTPVEVSLPGIKPQDLGHLVVSAKFDTLSLRKAR